MATQRATDIEVVKPSGGAVGFVLDQKTKAKLRRVIDDGTPPNTQRAYSSDMRYFWTWCSAIGWTDEPVVPVPPEIVAKFVVDHLEGLEEDIELEMQDRGAKAKSGPHSIATIDRRVSTLSTFHKTKGHPSPCNDPTVSKLMSKARKAAARRGAKPNKKKAVIKDILEKMLETCSGNTVLDRRDRALLFFGWASGGRRRSEIVSAVFESLEERGENFVYQLGVTKTDQEGEGNVVPISGRAAEALKAWLDVSKIDRGPIFRSVDRHSNISKAALSDKAVALIVKERAKKAGLNAAVFAGHSLRSGFITESGIQGKSLLEAMKLSGHKTMQVAAGYHQAGSALLNETADLAG
ncbi:site-specific integrase [Rhizobium sp. BK176]|uniref:site-specific integrase n=1 Tax=Rhizobium sp. BK176 TaxID=2587071 RepID=UPI0021699FAD|nr:site-specific integrase [Rhizobium sp. BK176]MCS4089700.1 integrase [Rhizobium sp. BK176]